MKASILFPRVTVEGQRTPYMEGHRFKQTNTLDERLEDRAKRLRIEARGTPPGVERDRLIRLARKAEMAVQMNEWLKWPGVPPLN